MSTFSPLWTDWLIYLLCAVVMFTVVYVRAHEHLRMPWRQVACRPMAMSAALVLSVFVVIGLLDSVHYRDQQGELLSVLDQMVGKLRTQDEKTYSAPLAVTAFSRETIDDGKEGSTRDYPRLRFAGAHLDDPPREYVADVITRVSSGLLKGFLLTVLVAMLTVLVAANRRQLSARIAVGLLIKGKTKLPWRSLLFTFALLAAVIAVIMELSTHYHVMGTDKVGQDVLYQSLKSIRTGLVLGTLTTLILLPIAIILGISAGYFRGWVDDVIQYVYTTLNSIPSVLLIAAAVLMLQVAMNNNAALFDSADARADARLLALCVILGMTSWTGLARLLRAETLKLRELDYVQAATAFGVSHARIIGRHILPNVMHIVLISVVLDFSLLVLAEAVLSYVGVGVDPSMNSWGNMINAARLEMAREPMVWWSLLSAFAFMFILVLAANLLADAVRDAFDPRLASSQGEAA